MGNERIQVIDRAVELVGLIAKKGMASLADLSRETGYAVSTVARILTALASHGIIERTAGKKYRLGLRLVALASQVVPTRSLVEIAREPMLELARATGEDAGLAVLQGKEAVIIDWVYGPHPLKIIEPFSQTITLNCAFRKVLLAFQGDNWVRNYLQSTTFPRYTPHTTAEPEHIWEELQRIRRRRFAISKGENILDAGSVAAPVFAATREIVATVFVTCPLTRFEEADVRRLTGAVVLAGGTISRSLRVSGLSRQALTAYPLRP